MANNTQAERNRRYRQRQKLRGIPKIEAYVEPDVKAKLEALAQEAGSYNAAFEKLLACHESRAA